MGKIVKEARFSDAAYVVEVPHADFVSEAQAHGEPDDRFAAPFVAPSTNGHTERITLPKLEPSVDWEKLRADAEAIIDHAASDAESLIHQTQSKALELMAAAQTRIAQLEEEAPRRDTSRATRRERARLKKSWHRSLPPFAN